MNEHKQNEQHEPEQHEPEQHETERTERTTETERTETERTTIPPHSDEDFDPDHPDLQHEDGAEASEPDDVTEED